MWPSREIYSPMRSPSVHIPSISRSPLRSQSSTFRGVRPSQKSERFREEVDSLVRSESDCRCSIAAVLWDTQFALLSRCLTQLEAAWRQNFFVSVGVFHRATYSRNDTLRREAEQREKQSYHQFVNFAEDVSQWYDNTWMERADTLAWFCDHSFLLVEEVFGRENLRRMQNAALGNLLLSSRLDDVGSRALNERRGIQHLAKKFLAFAHFAEKLLEAFVLQGNHLFCDLAMVPARKYAFDLFNLSEMENVKFRWALMYRMEHAHRRYVVWCSLLSACRLAESWERLFVLQVYARRTGELLWFHDEQRILVVLENESTYRSAIVTEDEQKERLKLTYHGLIASQTLTAKSLVLHHKELIARSVTELSALHQRESIFQTAHCAGLHITAVQSEHRQQRSLLWDNESTARKVLEEFLLNHYQLIVQNWVQTEQNALRDFAAGRAMVGFDKYLDDRGFERPATVEENLHDAAAWDYFYGSPMIPRGEAHTTSRHAFGVDWGIGSAGLLVHKISSSPPPYSASAIERRLNKSRSPQRRRASPRRPVSLPREQLVVSPRSNDEDELFSSDGLDGVDSDEATMSHRTPFFASGGSTTFALGVIALECDEERSRVFFEREAVLSHVTLTLRAGIPTLEEGLRISIANEAMVGKRALFSACITQYRMAVVVAQEHSMRRRLLKEEWDDAYFLMSSGRLFQALEGERCRLRLTFLSDRETLYFNYFSARFSSHAKATAEDESFHFRQLVSLSNSEHLGITIRANQSMFTPALLKLQQKEQEIERELSSVHRNGIGMGHWFANDTFDPSSLSPIHHYHEEPAEVDGDIFESCHPHRDDSDSSLDDLALLLTERVDLVLAQEFNSRKAAMAEFQLSRSTLMLHVLPMIEELHRYDRMNHMIHVIRKLHRRGFTEVSIQAIVQIEQVRREALLEDYALRSIVLNHESNRLDLLSSCFANRRRVQNSIIEEASTLKVDVLFTLFFQQAVEIATKEDAVFADIQEVCHSQMEQLMDRKRLFFGLRLSDGQFLPAGFAATKSRKEKEMYYHLRVADSVPPARPSIQRNDIILAVQGCQVVTLASVKQALRMVKSNVAHFTILRARDGTTTTVSVTGVYRDDPPSRSDSQEGF